MRKLIPIYIRIPLLYAIMFAVLEYFIDSGDRPAFIKYPIVALFHVIFIFLLVAIEVVLNSVDKVSYHLLTPEEKAKYDLEQTKPIAQQEAFKKWMHKFTASKSINEESDVLLDHDYDGIKELDNALPPWWKYGFYITIVVGVFYLLKFEVWKTGQDQYQEYTTEMTEAKAATEAYLAEMKENVDEKTVVMLDAAGVSAGKELFAKTCVACHMSNGEGGVGPNLTDDYWIHGGSIYDVFKTIKYGYPDKGMQAWSSTYSPVQIQQIASYIKSLRGTNPPNAKAPQGDLYTELAKVDSTQVAKVDSVSTK